MRYIITFLFLLSVVMADGQVVNDDFSDNDFSSNPPWSGDDSLFVVNQARLQSNCNTPSKSFYLVTSANAAMNAEWHINIELQFNTSGANYTDYFIISDNNNLLSNVNGYFVRIGNTNDEISLYRKDGMVNTLIINGSDDRTNYSTNHFVIKVIRDAAGLFNLYSDSTATGNFFVNEGSMTDLTYTTSSYTGIVITQSTASFHKKHFIDDVYAGPIIVDVTPPAVLSADAIDSVQVDVLFSEAVDVASAEDELNYMVNNGLNTPSSALVDANNPALVHLTFTTLFTDALANTITINNINDLNNNTIAVNTTATFTYYAPVVAFPYEIVITEIMAAPNGVLGLPNAEYIELYNRGTRNIDLANFTLHDATGSSDPLPSYVLNSGKYVLLVADNNASLFSNITNIIGVSGFPSFNNSGDAVSIYNQANGAVDATFYTINTYKDPLKAGGGYSIERIDKDFTCTTEENWRATNNAQGGTPAVTNSIAGTYNDVTSPRPLFGRILGTNSVEVTFSEPMSSNAIASIGNYVIDHNVGAAVSAIASNNNTVVTLTFNTAFQVKTLYILSLSNNLDDCPGNQIANNSTLRLGVAEQAAMGDLFINEILFNPTSLVSDFVEIQNVSDKVIDLSSLKIANVDLDKNSIATIYPLNNEGRLIFPGEYVAVTENVNALLNAYLPPSTANIYGILNLPSYNDDRGAAVLLTNQSSILDLAYYNEKLHYPLLSDVEGVSMERLSTSRPSNDSTNWHSAAATVNYATPGYRNSQYTDANISEDNIVTIPKVFSPDNDGYDDVISFVYNFDKAGYTANMQIYNSNGQLVKYLLRNRLIAQSGVASWDGLNEDNEKATIGIYVLYTEILDIDGTVKKYKNAIVLGGMLGK